MKKRKQLKVLVGNIGSGKSTLCKKDAKQGYIILSRDALRYMVGGGAYVFDLELEPVIRKAFLRLLEICMQEKVAKLVVDETNMSPRIRKDYLELAKRYDYETTAIILPTIGKLQSVKRRMKSPHGNFGWNTWSSIWQMFHDMYVEPTLEEGFDSIIKL